VKIEGQKLTGRETTPLSTRRKRTLTHHQIARKKI